MNVQSDDKIQHIQYTEKEKREKELERERKK